MSKSAPVPADPALLAALTVGERDLIARIRAEKLSYLSDTKLASLAQTCRSIQQAQVPGLFLEAGCALGGSAIFIASLKSPDRELRIYDVFAMIPPPTGNDPPSVHDRYQAIAAGRSKGIGGDRYYGYVDNLYEVVQANLARMGIDCAAQRVSLIKGLVQDTLHFDAMQPVAFAHLDVDWYESVMTCLQRIFPRLAIGGSIILDDYFFWDGCRKATDEYLASVAGQVVLDGSAGSMKVTRIGV